MFMDHISTLSAELSLFAAFHGERVRTYLDPSAVTFTLQLIVGVVVAAGAAVGIIISKLKKKVKDKLGIDLEKKKEVEDDIVVYNDDQNGENNN